MSTVYPFPPGKVGEELLETYKEVVMQASKHWVQQGFLDENTSNDLFKVARSMNKWINGYDADFSQRNDKEMLLWAQGALARYFQSY